MVRILFSFLSGLIFIGSAVANANANEPFFDDNTLRKTQDLLENPDRRKKVIEGNKKAKEIDNGLLQLTQSPELSQEVYKLSSDIMADIIKKANGDPAKAQKMMNEAMRNPSGFAASFTPEQQKRLKELAEQIEGEQHHTPANPL